ncbi:MAG TPA: hypothetical protein VGA13_02590 [Acidimicrobiales bacterium]
MSDDAAADLFAEVSQQLLAVLTVALPDWAEQCVRTRVAQYVDALDAEPEVSAAGSFREPGAVDDAVASARRGVSAEIVELGRLLTADVDGQRTNPLHIVREAVRHPTAALHRLDVPSVVRDQHAERLHPGDVYDLMPTSFADVGASVGEVGLAWGAAKVIAHRSRHEA